MLEHCCGDLLPFSHKSICEVGHGCWAIKAGSQSTFQFIPKMFDGVEVRAMCRPVKFFHNDLDKSFLIGPHFAHGCIVMLKQERAFPKLLPKSWNHKIVYNVIACCSEDFPSLEQRGLARTMKNSLIPLFLLHQTLQSVPRIGAGSAPPGHQPNTDLSVELPDGIA